MAIEALDLLEDGAGRHATAEGTTYVDGKLPVIRPAA
jgi:hypothetical protein